VLGRAGAVPDDRGRRVADRFVVRRAAVRLRVGRFAAEAGVALAAPAADAGLAADDGRFRVADFFRVDDLRVDGLRVDGLRVDDALVAAGFAADARLRVEAALADLAGFARLVDLLDVAAFGPLDAAVLRVLLFVVREVFLGLALAVVVRRLVVRRAGRFLPTGRALTSGLTSAPLRRRKPARTSDAAPSWAVRLATSASARAMALARRTPPTFGPDDRFDFDPCFFAIAASSVSPTPCGQYGRRIARLSTARTVASCMHGQVPI
jgi:hypothetical protein